MTNIEKIKRGKQLAFARSQRGFSQLRLVKKVDGLTLIELSRYENGIDNSLNDEMIKTIMDFLDWPLDWLDRRVGYFEPIGE